MVCELFPVLCTTADSVASTTQFYSYPPFVKGGWGDFAKGENGADVLKTE